MKKEQALKHWQALDSGQNPLSSMEPIPYKTSGSRYGCSGIRIDGSPEFVDAVLSNLKALLDGENCVTRLELSRSKVKRQAGFKAGQNAGTDAEVCYIRLHERGHEGAMASAYNPGLRKSTERFSKLLGVEV